MKNYSALLREYINKNKNALIDSVSMGKILKFNSLPTICYFVKLGILEFNETYTLNEQSRKVKQYRINLECLKNPKHIASRKRSVYEPIVSACCFDRSLDKIIDGWGML